MRLVARSLEPVGDVGRTREPDGSRRLRRGQAPRTAPADEIDVGVRTQSRRAELGHETRIDLARREFLPRRQDHSLAERRQIGKTDIGPFGHRAHVHQRRIAVAFERSPGLAR